MIGIDTQQYEYCFSCDSLTERAGKSDDSLYCLHNDCGGGPYCHNCFIDHMIDCIYGWYCYECGESVDANQVAFDEKHESCGHLLNERS